MTEEYISRKKVRDAIFEADCYYTYVIDELPSADVAPVRHGKWVEKHYGGNLYAHVCSECGAKRNVLTYGYKFNYCSSCGAKMDADEKRMINEPSGVL